MHDFLQAKEISKYFKAAFSFWLEFLKRLIIYRLREIAALKWNCGISYNLFKEMQITFICMNGPVCKSLKYRACAVQWIMVFYKIEYNNWEKFIPGSNSWKVSR